MSRHCCTRMAVSILLALLLQPLFMPALAAAPNNLLSYAFIPGPDYAQSDVKVLLKLNADGLGLPRHQVLWRTPEGTLANCRPAGGWCNTTFEYWPNGQVKSATWEMYIAGQGRPSGTWEAVAQYCTSFLGNTCIGWADLFRANFTITDQQAGYNISGNAGTGGATLSYFDGTARTATADGAGDYTIRVPPGWSGTVTPAKADHFFSPASRSYTNVMADQTAQDYTAVAITSWTYLPLAIR